MKNYRHEEILMFVLNEYGQPERYKQDPLWSLECFCLRVGSLVREKVNVEYVDMESLIVCLSIEDTELFAELIPPTYVNGDQWVLSEVEEGEYE